MARDLSRTITRGEQILKKHHRADLFLDEIIDLFDLAHVRGYGDAVLKALIYYAFPLGVGVGYGLALRDQKEGRPIVPLPARGNPQAKGAGSVRE